MFSCAPNNFKLWLLYLVSRVFAYSRHISFGKTIYYRLSLVDSFLISIELHNFVQTCTIMYLQFHHILFIFSWREENIMRSFVLYTFFTSYRITTWMCEWVSFIQNGCDCWQYLEGFFPEISQPTTQVTLFDFWVTQILLMGIAHFKCMICIWLLK